MLNIINSTFQERLDGFKTAIIKKIELLKTLNSWDFMSKNEVLKQDNWQVQFYKSWILLQILLFYMFISILWTSLPRPAWNFKKVTSTFQKYKYFLTKFRVKSGVYFSKMALLPFETSLILRIKCSKNSFYKKLILKIS